MRPLSRPLGGGSSPASGLKTRSPRPPAESGRRNNGEVSGDGYTRLYATVTGAVLTAAGLFGFLVGAEFESPELTGTLLGFYEVNGWSNAFHTIAGVMALALAARGSRIWVVIAAILFTGLGIWGVLAPDGTLLAGVLPAPRTVNICNLLLGLLAVAALVAGPAQARAERRRTRKRARRVRPRPAAARASSPTSTRPAGSRPEK